MKNKQFQNSHLIVSTDLEPDDVLALMTLFSELKKNYIETRSYPSIQFLVGESSISKKEKMQEIVAAARADGLIPENAQDIEVLNGFTSKGDEDFTHKFYAENFFKTNDKVSNEEINESRNKIIEKTAQSKAEGKNIRIFAWKPMEDLMALNDSLKLNEHDSIYLSGSYNVRQLIDWSEESSKIASCDKINSFLKSVSAELNIFEAFATYEMQERLPKQVAHYSDNAPNSPEKGLTKVASAIQQSNMSIVSILRDSVINWNKGIMKGQTGKLFKILKSSYPENESSLSALEGSFNEAYKNEKSIEELQSIFIGGLAQIFGKDVLKGSEKTPDDYDKSLKINDIKSFSRKWKIVNSIFADPCSMLIGDASTVIHAFNPDIYNVTKGIMKYDPKSGYSSITEGQAQILNGVKDYDILNSVLADAVGTKIEVGVKRSK